MKISDFNISGEPIPEKVADKILEYHLTPMKEVLKLADFSVSVSAKSGYRSKDWELRRGRSGGSQHCYTGKGAADYTCFNFRSNKGQLLELLIKYTDYSRICVYNSFIHCDHKEVDKRQLFKFTGKWEFVKNINHV